MKRSFFVFIYFLAGLFLFSQSTKKFDELKENAAKLKTAESYLYVSEYAGKHQLNQDVLFAYWDSAYHAAKKEKSDIYLGMYYYQKENYYDKHYPDSLTVLRSFEKQALYHLSKGGIQDVVPYLNMKIGMNFLLSGAIDSSFIYLNKTVSFLEKHPKNTFFPADEMKKLSLQFIFQGYVLKGKNKEALKYGDELKTISLHCKDSALFIDTELSIAGIYNKMGNTTESYNRFISAAKIATESRNYPAASSGYRSAAGIKNELGEYNEAIELNEKALHFSRLAKDQKAEGACWDMFASIFIQTGKKEDAIDAYRRALSSYEKTKDKEAYQLTQTAMMELFYQENQQDSAWNYMNKLVEIGIENFDSLGITGSFHDMKLKQLLAEYTSNERKVKLDILGKQYAAQELKSLKQRIYFIAALAALIVSLLLLLYNRQRQKTKAERMKRYAEEKENEYLVLQKNTELRLVKNYIDGLESERARIAKELHDGVCNDLLALEINLKSLTNNTEFANFQQTLSETRENVRHISHELMPPVFQYATLDEMISDYVSHLDVPDSLKIEYFSDDKVDWSMIQQEIAFELYRIMQEALNNCIKHANATHILVTLSLKEHHLCLTVEDNGLGFDISSKHKSIGLHTIRERAKSIDGKLYITSDKNGTKIMCQCDNVLMCQCANVPMSQ